jgi:2-oxoglutarate dehydrogenase E1 component
MEPQQGRFGVSADLRRRILAKLTQAEEFERLLHTRFIGHKRFSLEGGEALIPALDHLLNLAGAEGAEQIVLGMSHRGRLNVLATILGMPMSEMFSKFEDLDPDSVEGSGDVKYHIGAEGEHTTPAGRAMAIELIANPSHLEQVDPVVEGSTRARQDRRPDPLRQLILPVLIHGDAAFAGQGIVAETLNLSQLGGYRTGGTVHIVVNNQIGFTTSPTGARSSLYSTDIARTVQAPIFHVNGDRPEAVLRAIELAYGFRRRFRKDVVVDIVCYRRHGHNEGDDPSLTAPVLYRKIDQHPSVRALYEKELVAQGTLTAEEAETTHQGIKDALSEAAAHKTAPAPDAEPTEQPVPPPGESAASAEELTTVGTRLGALPESFHLHPKLRTFIERRLKAVTERGLVDWSLAEALALGSLALDGVPVRLSGQDTGRGTFSQRHAVLYDHEDGSAYIPLAHLSETQQPVEVYDSLLSEAAALGFEFGYAMSHPTALVLWEAQFGDFANGAQVIIDQFLAASQTKWSRTCSLSLLLPHGYEGQGPEHSSARMERFLQLSAENNWRVANCTTAAQYFHLLRSQGRRHPRLPLIVFTPKSLLRNPEVASPFAALTEGSFLPVLPDQTADPGQVRRVVLCCGKVFYDLAKARQQQGDTATAIVRLERPYPFPADEIEAEWTRYPQARELRWVQEEPENMGAWTFVAPRLEALLQGRAPLRGISRRASSSPATGSLRRHQQEQAALVAQALAE